MSERLSTPVTIAALEVENVKRIKAVQFAPAATGLTVLGGGNNQGKTSVLDAIAWALRGERDRLRDRACRLKERMDALQEQLRELHDSYLQAIATRVSTGGECQIIIEDGQVQTKPAQWQKGVF